MASRIGRALSKSAASRHDRKRAELGDHGTAAHRRVEETDAAVVCACRELARSCG